MAQIAVNGLTFGYDGSYENVFDHVSFSLDTSWKTGLIGRNGRGKTTLLRLMMGELEYRGSISAPVRFSYFPFEVEDGWALCGDLADEISEGALRWKILRELNALGMDEEILYRPYCTLSGGERTKLLLALLFLRENGFLLIDEPTNHLDMDGREVLERYLADKNGYILVSHDRRFLDLTTDHTVSINRSGIEIVNGSFSVWNENKQRRDAFEARENERLSDDIQRLQSSAARAGNWADRAEASKRITDDVDVASGWAPKMAAKSAKMQKRRKAIEKRTGREIEEKKSLMKDIEKAEDLKITPLCYFKKRMIDARDLALYYGDRRVASGLTFSVEQGDRIAVTGHNGCGKSTLLKLLCGEEIEHTGNLVTGSGLKISAVPQDVSGISGTVYDIAEREGCDITRMLTILRKLDFSRELFERDCSGYSMGQKKKVMLAASLATDAHLYVWDEPLNYVDIFSRMQIEQLLTEFAPTVVFVEHDAQFCDNIATKRITFGV